MDRQHPGRDPSRSDPLDPDRGHRRRDPRALARPPFPLTRIPVMEQPDPEPRHVASPPSSGGGSNRSAPPRAWREAESPSRSDGAPPSKQAAGCSRSVDAVARFVEDLGTSTSRLFEVYSDRTPMSLRQGFQRAAIGAAFGACIGIFLGASTLAIFRGACDGLAALWGGQAWSGVLAGGT